MRKHSSKERKIADLLYEKWDPLGLKSVGAPTNQYRRYASHIVSNFDDTSDEGDIFEYLLEVYHRCLAEPCTNTSNTHRVSKEVKSILMEVH